MHLVQCLDRCANAQGQMAKLALYCVDEKPDARAYWSKALPKARQMATLALEPLKPVDEQELRQWHVKYQLEPHWPWPACLALFRHTVAEKGVDGDRLRLGHWAEAVKCHRPEIARLMPPLPATAAAA
jgi:hypothetical protein